MGDADGIFMQTVSASGDPGAEARVNSRVEGTQDQPDVAMLLDGRAVIVWRSATGDRRAIPGSSSGFPFNSVSGQNSDFVASDPTVQGARRYPAVAIGGGGHVAIGWQDDSDAHSGVFVRRFPLPSTR